MLAWQDAATGHGGTSLAESLREKVCARESACCWIPLFLAECV
jgi:hypothetical protein